MILGHPEFSVQPVHASIADDSLFIHFQQGKILLSGTELPVWSQVRSLLPTFPKATP